MRVAWTASTAVLSTPSAALGLSIPRGWKPTFVCIRIVQLLPISPSLLDRGGSPTAGVTKVLDGVSTVGLSRNRVAPFSTRSRLTRFANAMEASPSPTDAAGPNGEDSVLVPLIDVDCNLMHPDLVALASDPLGSTAGDSSSHGEADDENAEDERVSESSKEHPEFKILRHPATAASNIRAVVSPAGTLDEGDRSLQIISSLQDARFEPEATAAGGEERPPGASRPSIQVRTTVGIHPYHAQSLDDCHAEEQIRRRMTATLESPHFQQGRVACVGECGLDYSEGFPPREVQLSNFQLQLDLAFQYKARLFLHERMAFQDTLRCIDEAAAAAATTPGPILIHCFTGNYEECEAYIKRGYYISLAGFIFKEGAEGVRRALREGLIPLNRLMVETDAPYLGFAGCRDDFYQHQPGFEQLTRKKQKRLLKSTYPNPPSSLPLIIKAIADELNAGRKERGEHVLDVASIATATAETAADFFGFEQRIDRKESAPN